MISTEVGNKLMGQIEFVAEMVEDMTEYVVVVAAVRVPD